MIDDVRAEAVLVVQRAAEHVGDELEITARMRSITAPGREPILVEYPQRAEAHVARIDVLLEGEGMAAVEPADPGPHSLAGRTNGNQSSNVRPNSGSLPREAPLDVRVPEDGASPGRRLTSSMRRLDQRWWVLA